MAFPPEVESGNPVPPGRWVAGRAITYTGSLERCRCLTLWQLAQTTSHFCISTKISDHLANLAVISDIPPFLSLVI